MTRTLWGAILLIASTLALAACGTPQEPLRLLKTAVTLEPDHLPLPSPVVSPEPVEVKVVTPKNAATFARGLKAGEAVVVLPLQHWLSIEEAAADAERYVREALRLLCGYRASLKEAQCAPPAAPKPDPGAAERTGGPR